MRPKTFLTAMNMLFYHSLHNRFILFDWRHKTHDFIKNKLLETPWPETVKNLCVSHGNCDGVLVLTNKNDKCSVTIFNADGSDGQVCLNGARCVAHHLYQEGYKGELTLFMGGRAVTHVDTTQFIDLGEYIGQQTINPSVGSFTGHNVDVGNPHFIIFAKQTREWLEQHGNKLAAHSSFPNQTNVEFVWPDAVEKNTYHALVYERGCGVTQACSSGAAAITTLLFEQNKIKINEKITLQMLGGSLQTWVAEEKKIALQAEQQPENF